MNSKNEDIYIQGRYYEPEDIDIVPNKNEIRNRPIGSNPDGKRDPNAFCKYIDALIVSRELYTKDGTLIVKRKGNNYYDEQGKLIQRP